MLSTVLVCHFKSFLISHFMSLAGVCVLKRERIHVNTGHTFFLTLPTSVVDTLG